MSARTYLQQRLAVAGRQSRESLEPGASDDVDALGGEDDGQHGLRPLAFASLGEGFSLFARGVSRGGRRQSGCVRLPQNFTACCLEETGERGGGAISGFEALD